MGEVLTQVWLKEMNELFDKEVNAQKESLKKSSWIHVSSWKPMRKCAMKMKEKMMST